MVRTTNGHNQNKNLILKTTKDVPDRKMDAVIKISTSVYFSSKTALKILK